MTQDMRTGRYTRFIVTLLLLLMCGAGKVLADDITVIIDNGITHGTVTSSIDQTSRVVTLTVTPDAGYKTRTDLIMVEKMVNPGKQSAPRRAPGLGTFPVTGPASDPDGWKTAATNYTFTVTSDYDGAYVTVTFVSTTGNLITSLSEIPNTPEGLAGTYELAADVDASGFNGLGEFKGTLDGKHFTIHHLDHPLFASTDGATIRNVNFENVNISTGDANGDAGAVTSLAKGATRIYNCGILPTTTEYDADGNVAGFYGSSISGTGNVGGLVGTLSDNARVINCFSYATIANGNYVGGIVGYNSVASSQSNVATMVMNCMFYGDITGGNTISPVYGGKIIDNRDGGLATYNYYAYSQLKTKAISTGKYNCALAMEERFLNRCEIYRQLLNSNKKLAAIYATGSAANSEQMAKWILETADRQIANPMPYPVLRKREQNKKYPSIINYDAKHAPDSASVGRLNGGKLGKTLSVTISNTKTDGGQSWPTGAEITATTPLTLQRTDKDTTRCNFNYDKVQLPYYNDVGTGNYTGYRVVTGWKIVSVSGGTVGDFHAGDEFGGYNFADRKCTNKDVYSVSGRVFSQGAYYDVPYGVTAITIEPYWGQAAYVSDQYYDVVYNQVSGKNNNYTSQPVTGLGTQYDSNPDNTSFNLTTQKVYTTIENARASMKIPTSGKTVYDYAVVLVGNVHQAGPLYGAGNTPYTIMSVDLDKDNEPDYSFIFSHYNRQNVSSIRFDFVNVPGTAQAQKPNGATQLLNVSIFNPKGWFEVTNTCNVFITQFEADNSGKTAAPVIFLGGVIDQYTSTKDTEIEKSDYNNRTQYIHLGSNACFKDFGNGTHSDGWYATRHVPVSVTGGDFDGFYLSGVYRPDAQIMDDDAEGYISGGRFKEVAGAAQQMINGNVRFQIYNADITNFYGGGINAEKPITGNVTVDIFNSHVDTYCGGPKFGDMQKGGTTFTTKYSNDKAGTSTGTKEITIAEDGIVTTTATGCTFGKFFGAGYGGASSYKLKYYDKTDKDFTTTSGFTSLIANYNNDRGKYYDGQNNQYKTDYGNKGPGVATDFDYEFFVWSSGIVGARFYVYYTTFSMAKTNNVYSYLTKCTVNENFYGGGSLGVVNGTATSELTDCNVKGSVYGGGYSASIPSVPVRATGFAQIPIFNANSGIFEIGKKNGTDNFKWKNATLPGGGANALVNGEIPTDVNLDNLGAVTGNVSLTIDGKTVADENGVMMKVSGSVYGGGEESVVNGNTIVTVTGGTIGTENEGGAEYGNVYGGGKGKEDDVNAGLVKGNTNVTISGTADATKIIHNVYGGGAFGSVGTFTAFDAKGFPTACTENTGTANITITGGTFGSDGKDNGMVFGSSRGSEGDPAADANIDKIAWVGNTNVIIGTSAAESNANPWIKGSVYGGGENGHNYQNGHVTVHSGTIGITDSSVDGGARYSTRGNVYGGGCGTDTFDRGEGDNKKTYYNFNAGIVLGNTQVDIDGGHIVHNVYGGGAMGTVGTYTLDADGTNDIQDGMPTECAANTGLCTINITGGKIGMTNATMTGHGNDGPDDCGHVFGAGRGYSKDPNVYPNIESCAFFNNTQLTISGKALVCGSVYGGSESGHVLNNTNVTISGGQIGCGEGRSAAYTDSDFASESLPTTNHWTYTEAGMGAPYDQYASSSGTYSYTGDFAYIPEADRKATSEGGLPVATDGRTFYGNVFAGGSGYYPYAPGLWLKSAGHIGGTATVTVSGGHILNNLYGGCEMADIEGAVTVTMTGGTIGVPRTSDEIKANPNSGNIYGAGMGDKRIFFNTSTNVASATVNISNGTVYGAVYGGGEDGHVMGNATTTISQPAGKTTVIGCDGQSGYDGNVFGAGQGHIGALTAGVVGGNASLTITGGTLNGSAYGGGRIASVGTNFAMATIDDPNNPGQKIPNPLYGKMQDGNDHGCLTVSLTGGTIKQNVYGGCMGTTADVLYGESKNVLVELNKNKTATDKGCAVKGDIFGCNNVNSTPQGDVTVHVYATQNAAATQIANANEVTTAKEKGRYDVNAVYGGGNLAVYNPVTPYDGTSGSKTQVIIEGCDLTSIETVYGGGNAAAVPETNVVIKGAYEIGYLFGGGNGKDDIAPGVENPGADVGTPDHGTTTYGTGNANTLMEGGLIHEAYGGSNMRGIIKGAINQETDPKASTDPEYCCDLEVEKIVGAGKYADVDGDVNMTLSCQPSSKVDLLFAGADEANVNGNITLNITNGHFGKVFGGNNLGGAVKGKITVNVEETGCQPIKIDELYLGGNEAAYSIYGYYESDETQLATGKKILKPRTSATDSRLPVKPDGTKYTSISEFTNYAQPELNIISCTYIGEVFGGGLGAPATMYANPSVNINMVQGSYADTAVPAMMTELNLPNTENTNHLGVIENVYGGGNAAPVIGETHVNIGTEQTVGTSQTVLGAYITGNVYGGGKLANVGEMDADIDNITAAGRTFVNIGAKKTTVNNQEEWQAVAAGKGVTIKGNVYGGGKGEATTFKCEKAIVAGSTNVMIGNGAVNGVVYGGGQLGRVETGTTVTIGIGDGVATGTPTSEPQINGDVYGAGAGVNTHGYAALVRGISEVTIQGNAKVGRSVYGGGQIASVGRYKVKKGQGDPSDAPNDVEIGMPYTLADSNSKCIVTVKGYAEIGPDNMQMKATGGPDDTGYVFGAGKGVLPYEGYAENEDPVRWTIDDNNQYVQEVYTSDKEDLYLKYVGTLALATETEVTIGGHAFVKGSVYGGSENGHVQHDTNVKIEGNCQIGNGWNPTLNSNAGGGVNERYNENLFVNPATATAQQIETAAASIYECAHWDYTNPYTPYDKNGATGGGATTAKDGHTFYGNVFGGGSGLYPYKSRKYKDNDNNYIYEWLRTAGRVEGNTNVIITGGHILTSVYGGCELTDVGNGVSVETNKGRCFVKMSGGTLGVPRTLAQIAAHPVTCYLFGAGKGDQRVHFDQWTNVGKVRVEINDSISQPIIYGSAFGGGEDGHVLGDVSIDIKTMNGNDPVIGTWGTSYVDGNVFGGGRGFGGDALTAGVVSGNVYINISGGKMLGSIYGGGRLGSVGTYLVPSNHANYGSLIPDGTKVTIDDANGTVTETTGGGTHGHVTINISGGTIGNSHEYTFPSGITTDAALTTWKGNNHVPNTDFEYNADRGYYMLKHTKGGNVFTGAMGRLYALDGSTVLPRWIDLGKVKSTKLNISGSAVIKSSIYGGGELGWTSGTHKTSDNKDVSTEISITGGTIGSEITDNNVVQYTYGSVFGGGYGSAQEMLTDANSNKTYPKFQAGRVMNSTAVTMSSGTVKASVYGGGELANVGYGFNSFNIDGIGETALTQASDAANTYVTVSGGTIGRAPITAQTGNTYFGGATMGNVCGGGSGNKTISRCGLVLGNTYVNISGTTRIYHNVYGGGAYGSVGDYEYTTGTTDPNYPNIVKVFGINSLHTPGTGTANVSITGGTIGYDGKDNGMVFGSSRGDVQGEDSRDDYMAWVNDAFVTIGTSSSTTGPDIRGSVYGSGENGHVFHDTDVKIYSGTIGIDNADTSVEGYAVISGGTTYNGPEYASRGNVYGGGCGTDTYTKNDKEYFNPTAGIVKGNTKVTMTGGHVVRAVYGGGSMGSVGTFTSDADSNNDIQDGKPISCATNTGKCTVVISGGKIGPRSMSMPNYYGNVFGAGRGEMHAPADYPNLETSAYFNETDVTITGTAFVKGSVYGGAESGHVLNDTKVEINGNCQIGCGYDGSTNGAGDLDRVYTAAEWAYDVTTDNTKFLYECNSWPYQAPYTPYDKFADENGKYPDNSSADNAHSTGTDGHTFYGNVFGGGSGSTPYAPGKWLPTAGWVEGNTTVEIKGGHILTSVYGGNEMSDVGAGGVRKMTDLANETADMFYDIRKPGGGKCTVKMSGGTLGVPRTLAQIAAHPLTCYLFGAGKGDQRIFFNKTTNVKEVEVEVSGGRIYGSVFGGGEDGHVMKNVTMTIKDNAYIGTWGTSYVDGNVFGGGRGFSGEALTAGNVGGCVEINIQGGTMLGSVYGGGRLGSVGYGLYLVDETVSNEHPYGVMRPNNVDDRGKAVSNFNRGYITINISGGTIGNNIEYMANPTAADKLKMPSTTFDSQNHLLYTRGGNVFAGCMGRLYSLKNELLPLWPKLGRCKQTTLNITGGTIKSNVYGGAELGVVEQNTSVNITGGQVGTQIGTGSGAYYYGSVFGSGKGSNDNITSISEAGTTGGDVEVHLNKGVAANTKGGIVRKVFGCNDMNGTPKGDVLVHIHATQSEGTDNIATKAASGYDVDYVFGGGNNADYVPTVSDAKQSTEVIIEGCDLTSIEEVYGGGFGAATPGTKVEVRGTKIINNLFGGGYGAGENNPGANVGIRTDGTTEYGNTGAGVKTAVVRLMAGNVNNVYGGSNTKGDIRGGSSITNIDKTGSQGTNQPCCDNLNVNNIYGGGKDAEMAGGAEIVLGCMPNDWISEIYAGAENADVGNDVSLTLTSGKFGRVFGGNKSGGKLDGQIEVNIEESETCGTPIIIGELYGGGNLAPYSIYGYNGDGTPRTAALPNVTPHNSPRVNVRRFTSIGNIFGGGLGANAVMVGSPTVNINEVTFNTSAEGYEPNEYNPATDNTKPSWIGDGADQVKLWPHTNGQMGVIGNVFGGGNAAQVIGDTHVNIATESSVKFESIIDNTIEGDDKRVSKTVVGADIRGNVYGGGNNAEVTGNANVTIGKKKEGE